MSLIKQIVKISIAVFVLCCVSGCLKTANPEALQIFSEAQDLFEKTEKLPKEEQNDSFRRVAAAYQKLIDKGIRSGPIYYNMGNAWVRCDEIGKAIAAYQLAKRYEPLDPYIASNLQLLGAAESPKPIIEHILFWQDWIGVRQKYVLSVVLIAVVFLAGLTALFFPHRRIKRTFWILSVLTSFFLISTGYDYYRFEYCQHAVIAVSSATPRKGNSEHYEPAFTTPPHLGTNALVLDKRGNWVHLRFAAEQDAWLPQNQVVLY